MTHTLEASENRSSAQTTIFVARPFNQHGQNLLDEIVAPVLQTASMIGLHGPRADAQEVVQLLRLGISSCAGMIAIISGRNLNVFVETGMAIALKKPLILLADANEDCAMLLGSFPIVLIREVSTTRDDLLARLLNIRELATHAQS